nr:UDP-glucose--hexose-1-phosphate uridylyltransferase [Allomuricauda sp.]
MAQHLENKHMNLYDNSHYRLNILTNEWVLVTPHRTKRPWQGKKESLPATQAETYDPSCYLCPGNKRASGDTNPNYTEPYSFVNDFSALLPEVVTEEHQNNLMQAKSESGICKVVCFSPDHSLTLPVMRTSEIEKVISLWQKEYKELGDLPDINHVLIFENKGAIMGCSNPHPHGQIWAQKSIPTEVLKKCNSLEAYWNQHQRSILEDYIQQEIEANERIISLNNDFVALVPYWAVWPYEVMIAPTKKLTSISELDESQKRSFAEIIKTVTICYDNLFETSFPYSAGINQAPTDGKDHPEWHFHMSFYPPLLRSANVKKFMVGYEMFANPQRDITAEQVADTLKQLPTKHYSQNPR